MTCIVLILTIATSLYLHQNVLLKLLVMDRGYCLHALKATCFPIFPILSFQFARPFVSGSSSVQLQFFFIRVSRLILYSKFNSLGLAMIVLLRKRDIQEWYAFYIQQLKYLHYKHTTLRFEIMSFLMSNSII